MIGNVETSFRGKKKIKYLEDNIVPSGHTAKGMSWERKHRQAKAYAGWCLWKGKDIDAEQIA